MGVPFKQQRPLDEPADQQALNKLVRLIRKLRWMGMDKEAEAAQKQLVTCKTASCDSVLAIPRDTD
jgi:hypothetical protein